MRYTLAARESAIFAVVYWGRRAERPVRLPDGTTVSDLSDEEVRGMPRAVSQHLSIGSDGRVISGRPARVPPDAVFVRLTGSYRLPSGDVAAVYGATARPIG